LLLGLCHDENKACVGCVHRHTNIYYSRLRSSFGRKRVTAISEPLLEILLEGPITKKKAELSGMAWMDDTLVLLPQYPEEFGDAGVLFAIPKQSILDYLDGKADKPISPETINIVMPKLKDLIPDYEGFESIEFHGQDVYLTIESGKGNNMMGYLITGVLSPDKKEIHLDVSQMKEIPPPVQLDNRTDEALIIDQNKIYTFFEANGENINPHPVAHVFDLSLNTMGIVSFPHLEYGVTDATVGPDGGIWVINQIAPKDSDIYPRFDPLMNIPTQEITPDSLKHMERLIKLRFTDQGFMLADFPPIQIVLGDVPRNWEGLSLLDDRGFLLVTDKSPDTILGFVPMP
jgi:hypothetical protein